MSHNHFPGLNSAHANGRFLHNDKTPELLTSGDGRPTKPGTQSLRKLEQMREFRPLIGSLTTAGIADLPTSQTWDDLDVSVYDYFANQLDAMKAPTPNRPIDPIAFHRQDERFNKMKYGTKAALGLMMAMYEVIPRLVFKDEFENPNHEIGAIAAQADVLFLDWMRLSTQTDGAITYAMTKPKSKLNGFRSFFGMRFDAKWFEIIDNKPSIKTHKIPHMMSLWPVTDPFDPSRQIEVVGPVAAYDKPKDILFGCPASRVITKVHAAMVGKAVVDGLFAASYYAERKNYGFQD